MSALRVVHRSRLHSTLYQHVCRTLMVSSENFGTISALSTTHYSYPQSQLVKKIQPISWNVSKAYATKAKLKAQKNSKKSKQPLPEASDVAEIFDVGNLEEEFQEIVNNLKQDYIQKLNLRTTASAFEGIEISTKDGTFPLKQLGQIAMKSPQLLVINPGKNAQYVSDIKKSIMKSGLNVNPQIEGSIISIPLPKITKEHRQNLVKSAKTLKDKAKTDLQNVRQRYHKLIGKAKNEVSEDICFGAENLVQERLDNSFADVEKMFEIKKNELMNS